MANSIEDTFETATFYLKKPAFWIDSEIKRCTACNEESKKLFGVDTILQCSPQTLRLMMEEQHWTLDTREGRYGISMVGRPNVENAQSKPPTIIEGKTKQLKVMFLDDSKAQCAIAQNIIKKLGHACTVLGSSKDAVQALEDAIDNEEPFDVLVCDLILEGLENGVQLLQRIHRDVDSGIYSIAITSQTSHEISDSDLESEGFQAVLRKPFLGSALGRTLDLMSLNEE